MYNYGPMSVVCFANEKGGVGKTTSCVNIAACLGDSGQRNILVIDLDPQANATIGLGRDPSAINHNPADLFEKDRFPLAQAIVNTPVQGVDLVPANADLATCNQTLVKVGREMKLRLKLEAHAKDPTTKKYDFALIDCAPSVEQLTINGLMAATHLVVPVRPDYYSYQGAELVSRTVATLYANFPMELTTIGLLVTAYEGDRPGGPASHRALLDLLRDRVKECAGGQDMVLPQVIPKTVRVDEAQVRMPMVISDPEVSASHAYRGVTQFILDSIGGGEAAGAY